LADSFRKSEISQDRRAAGAEAPRVSFAAESGGWGIVFCDRGGVRMHSRSSAGGKPPEILYSENAHGTLRNHLLCVPMLRVEHLPSELLGVLIANQHKRRRLRSRLLYLAPAEAA
jgi:hypothetical protein